MKNLFNLTLSAVIALFLVTSCDKKETIQIKPKAEKEITAEQIKNSSNPYDKEGELHNKFLDYFIARVDTEKEINRDILSVIYEGFHKENELEFGGEGRKSFVAIMDAFSELKIGGPYIELDICKKFPVFCNITGTGPYNPAGILIPTNGTTSTERTLTYIEQIIEEETKILRNEKLKDDQKEMLLNYYAVARYSSAYWHNIANKENPKNGWDVSKMTDATVIDIIVTDAVGAGIVALVGPGQGCGPGAGVASAAAVLEKIWNWR